MNRDIFHRKYEATWAYLFYTSCRERLEILQLPKHTPLLPKYIAKTGVA